jgi:alpha-beta hydrolase superfamily lysophospholipase
MLNASPSDSSRVRRIEGFPVGYYNLHPDVSLNYEMNRFSTGEADMLAEIRAVAPRIHTHTDHTREFLALGQRALDDGRKLSGALYLRSAEFFMFGDDPRKQCTRRTYVEVMHDIFSVKKKDRFEVPYETGVLSGIRSTPTVGQPRGTLVICGGFDSYVEDSLAMLRYFSAAGYRAIRFDGPGQGASLEDAHLLMTHEWHRPLKAVLDYLNLDDVTLIGVSLGGCLALRAAADEPRVRRVIAQDVLMDFFECFRHQVKPPLREQLLKLLQAGDDRGIDAALERVMQNSLVTEWAIKQGMLVMGAKSPSALFHQLHNYRTDDVSPLVQQDVLLLAGTEDHFVPLHQFYDQIRALTHARSLTARLFTRQEQAHEHIQVGNLGLVYRLIKDWIDVMHERDSAQC